MKYIYTILPFFFISTLSCSEKEAEEADDTAAVEEEESTEEQAITNLGHNGPYGDESDLWEPELSWECYGCGGKDLADAHRINSVDVGFPAGICYNTTDKTTTITDQVDCADTWVQFPGGSEDEGNTGAEEGSGRDVCFVRQSDDSFTATEGACYDVDSSWNSSTFEASILQDCVDYCISASSCKAFDDVIDATVALADIDYSMSTEGFGCWIFSD
ncbi:MAG: hypothetical protein VX278_09895 [Myxococcota bacterium]|nr:hypothetical protein [Myxococcota bacterium]